MENESPQKKKQNYDYPAFPCPECGRIIRRNWMKKHRDAGCNQGWHIPSRTQLNSEMTSLRSGFADIINRVEAVLNLSVDCIGKKEFQGPASEGVHAGIQIALKEVKKIFGT